MVSCSALIGQRAFLGDAQRLRRSLPTGAQSGRRAAPVVTRDALVLVPSGDGTSDHLDKKVEAPGMITLKAGKSTLGRDEPSDIILQIPTVSNTHAELTVEGDKLMIKDLQSTNGTFINDSEMDPMIDTAVELGSTIVFGDISLAKFVLEDQ